MNHYGLFGVVVHVYVDVYEYVDVDLDAHADLGVDGVIYIEREMQAFT